MESSEHRKARLELEALTAQLLRKIVEENKPYLPEGVGFSRFLFDFGEKGNIAYASTGRRDDMIRAMREWLSHVES